MERAKNAYRRVRRGVHALLGRDLWDGPEVRCASERLGSAYGGWSVRPEWLGASSVVYGFGVGRDLSFDVALVERFGCEVHAFDPTPKAVAWVRGQRLPERLRFHAVGVASFDGEATFTLQSEDPEWDSYNLAGGGEVAGTGAVAGATEVHRLPVERVSTIMRRLGHDRIDLVKFDVEGAEFGVVEDMLGSGVRPRQVLVEYHYFEGGADRVERTRASIGLLRRAGYRLFSRSAIGHEFSFCLSEGEATR